MSLANGFNRMEGEARSLRRCAANVMTALECAGASGARPAAALRCVLAADAGDCCCHRHCRLSVSGLDARRCGEPWRRPPAALDHRPVRRHYRFRQVGMVPLAARSVVSRACRLAADVGPVLPTRAGGRHGAGRISVHRNRRAEPVRDHRQAHDRPRTAECRRQSRSVSLQSVQVGGGLCRHAVGTRHDGFRRACRLRDALAARPHGPADLCRC